MANSRDPSPTGQPRRLIVGISGASGAIYGIRLLELVHGHGIETHLIVSRAARTTIELESGRTVAQVEGLADHVHPNDDFAASCASGSFASLGMVVAPCSVKTLSEIASGVTASLMSRAADVTLKERRRLVLMVRETPLHLGHLRTMASVTEAGAVVFPPVPALYAQPATIAEMVDSTLGRVLELFGVDVGTAHRWGGGAAVKPRD